MKPFQFFRVFPVLFACALLAGCAAGVPAGKWSVEPGVQQIFESGAVLPDHTYYYIGSYAGPESIIAIDNRFTLRTRVWAKVDMTEELLNGWLQMYRTQRTSGCDFHGGLILTADGQKAGLWYSQNVINIIRSPEPGVLEVFQPHSISGAVCGQQHDGPYRD